MSYCKVKTAYDIHRDLCEKQIRTHSECDLIGPFDKYRDENYKIYKEKCAEFKAKGKAVKDANIKALTNHKIKLGEVYLFAEDKIDLNDNFEDDTNQKEGNRYFVRATLSNIEMKNSDTSINTIKETGDVLRKRHERYYYSTNQINEHKCTYDPWFGRYLILCKFINAVRTFILKRRLLKRLKILRKLTPAMILYYEKIGTGIEHLIHPEIFKKFTS